MIYPLLILLMLVFWLDVNSLQESLLKTRKEEKYIRIIIAIIVILSALRANSVGADTVCYRVDFEDMPYFGSLAELKERYEGYLGYYIPCKIASLSGLSVQVWFAIVQMFYLYAIYKFLQKFSKDKIFGILIFFTIGLYSFSVAGLKQTVANAWAILAFLSFIDKRYLKTIVFGLLAYSCHSCSLIFAGAFVLYIVRNTKYFLPLIIVFIIVSYFFADLLIIQMIDTLNDEHFEMYLEFERNYTSTTLIFYVILILLSLYSYKSFKVADADLARFSLGMCLFACGLQALASISSNAFRLAYFYTPYFMILIPNICHYHNANKNVLRFVYIFIIVFYFLYTGRNAPYEFFIAK